MEMKPIYKKQRSRSEDFVDVPSPKRMDRYLTQTTNTTTNTNTTTTSCRRHQHQRYNTSMRLTGPLTTIRRRTNSISSMSSDDNYVSSSSNSNSNSFGSPALCNRNSVVFYKQRSLSEDASFQRGMEQVEASFIPSSSTGTSMETPHRGKSEGTLPISPTSVLVDVNTVVVDHVQQSTSNMSSSTTTKQQVPIPYQILFDQACQLECQGQLAVALDTARKCLPLIKQQIRQGGQLLISAKVYHSIGRIHYKMGKYRLSLTVLEHALDVYQLSMGCMTLDETLVVASPDFTACHLAPVLVTMSRVYLSMGMIRDAKQYTKQALRKIRLASRTATVHSNEQAQLIFADGMIVLGMAYQLEGRHQDAIQHYQRALQIQRPILGDNHQDVANTIGCIGSVHIKVGWWGPAMQCFLEVLRVYRFLTTASQASALSSYASSSPVDVGVTLASIGWIYMAYGDWNAAMKASLDALHIIQACLSESHRNTSSIRFQIALIHARQGNPEKAIPVLKDVLAHQRTTLGEHHDDVAITLSAIGDAYQTLGRHSKAVPFLVRALEIRKKVWGKKHMQVGMTYALLGNLHLTLGDHDDARRSLENALKVYQANHIHTSDLRIRCLIQSLEAITK